MHKHEWADAVKTRDGKCLDCGSLHDLHAHHIIAKAVRPELAFDLDNGKTLCYRCHKAEHERCGFPRIYKAKPRRKTMEKQIEGLIEEVRALSARVRKLEGLIHECERGVCGASLNRRKYLKSVA